MPAEHVSSQGRRRAVRLADITSVSLLVLGALMGAGALITAGVRIALAAASAFAALAMAFALAGRWLCSGRRLGALVLCVLTLLLGAGAASGGIFLLIPLVFAVGAAVLALRSWRDLG